MSLLPPAFQWESFNHGIPERLMLAEDTIRIAVFSMPLLFTVGFSSRRQRVGLIVYLVGVGLYLLSYVLLIVAPQSAWSTSLLGFTAAAYINVFWMVGLGLLGEAFHWRGGLRYHPAIYIIPALAFLVLHVAHTAIVYQLHY